MYNSCKYCLIQSYDSVEQIVIWVSLQWNPKDANENTAYLHCNLGLLEPKVEKFLKTYGL